MAVDPQGLVSALGATGVADEPAPLLLTRPVDAAPPLPPLRSGESLATVHRQWEQVHAAPVPDSAQPPGLRGRADRHVAAVATAALGPAQQQDRALIGHLIRATDAVAERCDALADRVADLESMLAEVVEVLGADLVRLRAAAGAAPVPGAPATPPGARDG